MPLTPIPHRRIHPVIPSASIIALTCSLLTLSAHAQITTPPNSAIPSTPAFEFAPETKKPKSDAELNKAWQAHVANSEALMPEVILQTTRIEEEVKSLPTRTDLPASHWAHRWAGTYHFPDGMVSYRFSLAPQNGITHTSASCLPPPTANSGTIVGTFDEDNDNQIDGIIANWRYPRRDDTTEEKFYFVAWDGADGGKGRQLLIPESDMLDFVNRYNQGGFHRWHFAGFVERLNPEAESRRSMFSPCKPSIAPPQLPAQWASKLISTPISGYITRVDAGQRAAIDKGSADGVYLGMEILLPSKSYFPRLVIDTLSEHAAMGHYEVFREPDPKVGEKLQIAAGADGIQLPGFPQK